MYFILSTLRNAFVTNIIELGRLILRSDQGVHFSAHTYNKLLEEFEVIG